jgi:septum formation protein
VTRLLLASASPARRATLASAGIDPLVVVSSVDEPAVLAAATERFGALDPADAVLVLAQAKVEDVARALAAGAPAELADADDLVLLGCDSMLELDGEVLGKPDDAADAVRRWGQMRGRTGVLHTGHWVVDERATPDEGGEGTRGTLGATSSTVVHFADLSDGRSPRTSRRASRSRSRARSRSTGSAGRSSSGSRATTTASSGCRCRCCAACSARSA